MKKIDFSKESYEKLLEYRKKIDYMLNEYEDISNVFVIYDNKNNIILAKKISQSLNYNEYIGIYTKKVYSIPFDKVIYSLEHIFFRYNIHLSSKYIKKDKAFL